MSRNAMGSTQEDLITAEEAAEMLSVTVSMIRKMRRQGVLSVVSEGRPMLFRRTEIAVVAGFKYKDLDLATVANMAIRALVLSKSNEQRLDEVRSLLGMQGKALSSDEADVVALYIKAQDYSHESPIPAAVVREWAMTFFGINEEYLSAVELHTAAEEPWKPFLDVGVLLSTQAPREEFSRDKALESAYSYLELARRHLRQVSYFYVQNKYGKRSAKTAFPGIEGGLDEALIGMLFMH